VVSRTSWLPATVLGMIGRSSPRWPSSKHERPAARSADVYFGGALSVVDGTFLGGFRS